MAITIVTTTMATIMDEEFEDGDTGASIQIGGADGDEPAVDSGGLPVNAEKLLIWLSPAFPVGSFAFSHGLEWAVQAGSIRDVRSIVAWLGALLEHGALRNDAIFVTSSWRSTANRDVALLRETNQLSLAMAGSKERHLETSAQGNAFVTIVRQAWDTPTFQWATDKLSGDVSYPVAVGAASAAHAVALAATLKLFSLAQIQNLISAAIRLSVIGHTDGQRAIAALLPAVGRLAAAAETARLDDVGGAAFLSDIAALRHETQYSRLFRS